MEEILVKAFKAFSVVFIVVLTVAASLQGLHARQSPPASEIHRAARQGDLPGVKALLDKTPGLLESRSEAGKTPLHFAVEGGHADVVRYLLEKGAAVNAGNADGDTPLHYAAGWGFMDIIAILIENGADVAARSNAGDTPLHYVRFQGITPVAKALLDHGADVNARNKAGDSLLVAAFGRGRRDLIELLFSRGAVIDNEGGEGMKLLAAAVETGKTDLVDLLFSKGVRIKAEGELGRRLLHAAASQGNRDIVASLIAKGVDINGPSPTGGTLLHSAAKGNSLELARLLLGKSLDVNVVDHLGRTALQVSEDWGNTAFSELLRKSGARKTVRETVRIGTESARAGEHPSVDVSYISNEGFLVAANSRKILLDTPYTNPFGYIDTPEAVVAKLKKREAPFDRLGLMLFSHAHRDHFEPVAALAVLRKHPETVLVGNSVTLGELKTAGGGDLGAEAARVREFNPGWGTFIEEKVNGIGLKIFPVNHGLPEKPYVTLAYLFELGGFKILHLGDIAAPSNVDFFPKYGLEKDDVDIAFIDPFFLQDESGKKLLRDHIRPKKIILMHMRSEDVDRYLGEIGKEFDNVLAFHEPMQKMTFRK